MGKMIVEINGQLIEREIDCYQLHDKFGFMPEPKLNDGEMAVRVIGKDYPIVFKGQLS